MSVMQANFCSARSGLRGAQCCRSKRCIAVRCDKLDYKASGVDIQAGNDLVQRIKKLNPDIGGFNGMFPFGAHPTAAHMTGCQHKIFHSHALHA